MGGAQWTSQTHWLTASPTCDWFGIECDIFDQKIVEIVLSNNNLVNSIPVEVNLLRDLRALWMNENRLTGIIPALAIGELPFLTALHLEDNMLNGTISEELRTNGKLCKWFLACSSWTLCRFCLLPTLFSFLQLLFSSKVMI
jgi:hypothetical protein